MEVEGEWVRRLEEREKVWRARLSALDLQHKKQVQQLENMFTSSQLEGQEMKKDMERRLEEVLSKFEQSQTLIKSYQLASKNDEIKKNHNILESTLASSLSDLKIQSMELKDEKIAKNPSPFQRRKAFVSQKSKTIQDSVEAQQDENLVEILQPDVDSDIEIVSLKAQSNDTDKSVSNERSSKEIFEVVQDKDKLPEKLSKSKNTEMIVKKLLEEEKQRTFGKTSEIIQSSIEEDESSITETSTDSESEIETSEDKQNQELQKSGSADRQLLHAESQLAQQSLQR
ncbi:hypothetical protein J6590_056476 [Homalodisca vitripennis]|nr:hypothetical protein J6590_056476 [Homalodisca vitripennis]